MKLPLAIWAMGAASMLGELTLGLGNLISSGVILAFYWSVFLSKIVNHTSIQQRLLINF